MKTISQNDWRRLLTFFVDDMENYRPVLMKPFEQDGYVCATDAHALIRVDKKYITDDYSTSAKTPNVASVMPPHKPYLTITEAALRSAFVTLGMDYDTTTIDCPHCDNDCEVEWHFTDKDGDEHTKFGECPCCNGTGRLPNGLDTYCELDGKFLIAHFLLLLYHVMTALEVKTVKVSIGKQNQFRFNLGDGVDVVVMVCLMNNRNSKRIAKIKTSKL